MVASTSALSQGSINRAALAGRAMLQTSGTTRHTLDQNISSQAHLKANGSAGILALMEMQRRQSQDNVIPNLCQPHENRQPASNILAETAAAAAALESNNSNGNSNLS